MWYFLAGYYCICALGDTFVHPWAEDKLRQNAKKKVVANPTSAPKCCYVLCQQLFTARIISIHLGHTAFSYSQHSPVKFSFGFSTGLPRPSLNIRYLGHLGTVLTRWWWDSKEQTQPFGWKCLVLRLSPKKQLKRNKYPHHGLSLVFQFSWQLWSTQFAQLPILDVSIPSIYIGQDIDGFSLI